MNPMTINISTSSLKGVLFATLTACLWAVLAIVLKVTVTYVPPATIVWFRFTTAFVILFIYFLVAQRKALTIFLKPPILLVLAALFLGMNYIGYMQGIHYTTPNNTQLFIQLGPILLAVSGIVIYKEKVTKRQILGFLLALTGLGFFYSQQLSAFAHKELIYNKGVAWVIFGAVSWASYSVIQKKLVRFHPVHQLNLIIYGLPALLYIPLADFSIFADINWKVWLLLLFCGLNTLIAYGSLTLAFKYLEANKISVIIICNPIITFILMAFLGYWQVSWIAPEYMNFLSVFGAVLVITGAIFVVFFRKKKALAR